MAVDPLGVIIEDGPENGAQAAYHDPNGIASEVKTGPYILTDGVTLLEPVHVYDAGEKVGQDSAGNPVDAWPLMIEFEED
jgi:hypothetical protein